MTLTFLIIGLAGALLMFTGDQLLYLTKASLGKESGKTLDEKYDYIAEIMRDLPQKRYCAGGMIGPVAAFVYCAGFYHLLLVTEQSWNVVAVIAFLFNCFGIICGGAYHSHFPYFGILGADSLKDSRKKVSAYFTKLSVFTYIGEGIGFVLMIVMVAAGKTIFPRWCAIFNPGILMFLKPVTLKVPGMAGKVLSGGWSNLISIIYYAVLIVVYLVQL